MTDFSTKPFGTWAEPYRNIGLEPRCLIGKACKEKNWQKPDTEIPQETLNLWVRNYGGYNIGLRMGTDLPDGTRLGALDIDHDAYANLGKALLGDPPCGRIGKKGAVYFVRYQPSLMKSLKHKKFRVKGDLGQQYGQVLELLFEGTLCVIPPSIHPDINQPYRWIGTPLHETNFTNLPLIGE